MRTVPKVEDFMTKLPHSIGADQSIDAAENLMRKLHVRHLPVLQAGKLIGIISDRDIKLYQSFAEAKALHEPVGEICQADIYSVTAEAPLHEVVTRMAEKKIGSAIVVQDQKLVGIFTEIDAFKALSALLTSNKSIG